MARDESSVCLLLEPLDPARWNRNLGGAIFLLNALADIMACTFNGNVAAGGGAIYAQTGSSIRVDVSW